MWRFWMSMSIRWLILSVGVAGVGSFYLAAWAHDRMSQASWYARFATLNRALETQCREAAEAEEKEVNRVEKLGGPVRLGSECIRTYLSPSEIPNYVKNCRKRSFLSLKQAASYSGLKAKYERAARYLWFEPEPEPDPPFPD